MQQVNLSTPIRTRERRANTPTPVAASETLPPCSWRGTQYMAYIRERREPRQNSSLLILLRETRVKRRRTYASKSSGFGWSSAIRPRYHRPNLINGYDIDSVVDHRSR